MEGIFLKIDFSIKYAIQMVTYIAVHMPAAHISTDGCEALSAIQKFVTPRILSLKQLNSPLQRKIPGAGNFQESRNSEIL